MVAAKRYRKQAHFCIFFHKKMLYTYEIGFSFLFAPDRLRLATSVDENLELHVIR